jgi:hypothetical protein
VTPAPGEPIRFDRVPTRQPTACAVRFRVCGDGPVTLTATLRGDPAFVLAASEYGWPRPHASPADHILVWVLFPHGAAATTRMAVLEIVASTGQSFAVPVEAPG